jgi:hypothetical protein
MGTSKNPCFVIPAQAGIQQKQHLYAYMLNYDFNLKLRALGRVTPFEAMLHWYNKSPSIFTVNPNHLIMGLNK